MELSKDEIISLAREAGVIGRFDDVHPSIERLAALAFAAGAVHERAKELTGANISLYNLAKEAEFDVAKWAINGGIEVIVYEEGPITGELTRFAALVAAHVKSDQINTAYQQGCEDMKRRMEKRMQQLEAQLQLFQTAVADEREACAKVCDELDKHFDYTIAARQCAAAIRARGEN